MSKRVLTFVSLLFWGAFFLGFWGSGRIVSYLHPQFHALVAGAGFVLLVLAAAWWWASRGEIGEGCDECGCHHDHGSGTRDSPGAGALFAFGILLMPVGVATMVSSSQFGEAAVVNRCIVTSVSQLPAAAPVRPALADALLLAEGEEIPDVAQWPEGQEEGVEYSTRGNDGAIQLETIDLLFAAEEPVLREEFDLQRVSVTGQYVPPREGKNGRFDLVRMVMVCCAADARPIGIGVRGTPPPGLRRMGWVRVTGRARFSETGVVVQPQVEAEKIEEVPAPRETVLY